MVLNKRWQQCRDISFKKVLSGANISNNQSVKYQISGELGRAWQSAADGSRAQWSRERECWAVSEYHASATLSCIL